MNESVLKHLRTRFYFIVGIRERYRIGELGSKPTVRTRQYDQREAIANERGTIQGTPFDLLELDA